MKNFIMLHDCINPKSGLTYKEENMLIGHNIPLETKVRYFETTYDENENCIKIERILYVLAHVRDCDGTPLYVIGNLGNKVYRDGYENKIYNNNNLNGVREEYLEIL